MTPSHHHTSAAQQDIPVSRESVSPIPSTSLDNYKSHYDIQTSLLVTKEEEKETDSKNKIIFISKQRPKLISSSCPCKNEYNSITYQPDGFEITAKLKCTVCGHVESSTPTTVVTITKASLKELVYRTNILFAYFPITEDYGLTGLKRLQRALGMKPVGNSKHQRYLLHVYNAMTTHYKENKRKYMEQYTNSMHTTPAMFLMQEISSALISYMKEHG